MESQKPLVKYTGGGVLLALILSTLLITCKTETEDSHHILTESQNINETGVQENDPSRSNPSNPDDPNLQGTDPNNPDSQENDSTTSLIAWKNETSNVLVLGGNLSEYTQIAYYDTMGKSIPVYTPFYLDLEAEGDVGQYNNLVFMVRMVEAEENSSPFDSRVIQICTVTFLSSDGTEIFVSKIHSGGKVIPPDVRTVWWDENGSQFDFSKRITSDITLHTEAKNCIVTYNSNGGIGDTETQTVLSDTIYYIQKNSFTKEGYVFIGWKKANDDEVIHYPGGSFLISEDTVFLAQWAKGVVITFDANGGEGEMPPQVLPYGVSAVHLSLNTFSRREKKNANGDWIDGEYDFLGWSKDKNATQIEYQDAVLVENITESITLYAVWKKHIYQKSLYINGQEWSSIRGYVGEVVRLPQIASQNGTVFIPDMGSFCGWSNKKGGGSDENGKWDETGFWDVTRVKWADGANYTMGFSENESDKLYAVFSKKEFCIYFEGDGGTGRKEMERAKYESKYIITGNKDSNGNDYFSKEGYYFSGWKEKTNNGGTVGNVLTEGDTYTIKGNVTFVAMWMSKYVVLFDLNGGKKASSMQNSIDFIPGESVQLPNNKDSNGNDIFNRKEYPYDGYDFAGWAVNKYDNVVKYQGGQTYKFNSGLTLYAVWKPKTFTISFDANGGVGTQNSIQGKFKTSISLPRSPSITKENYVFKGWCGSPTQKTAPTNSNYTILKDQILYAFWEGKTCTITLDANGGTLGLGQNIMSKKYDDVLSRNDFPNPTRQNYNFKGWREDASTGTAISSYTVKGNKTLYAMWEEKTYTVKFDKNDTNDTKANEATGTQPNMRGKWNSSITLPANTNYSRANYDFQGWAETPSATTAKYCGATGVTSYTIPGDATLYAVWKPKNYTITFDAGNGGSGTRASVSVPYNDYYQFPSNKDASGNDYFSKTDFYFIGWKIRQGTSSPLSSTTYNETNCWKITGDTTLVAQWSSNFVISFDANGGTGSQESLSGGLREIITLPTNKDANGEDILKKQGYSFAGWANSSDSINAPKKYKGGDAYTVTENMHLYAVWKINSYTVHFDSNGGSGAKRDITAQYFTQISLEQGNLSKVGHTFKGWAETSTATTPKYPVYLSSCLINGNMTLYAVWEANSYTITFNANGGTGTQDTITKKYGESFSLPQSTFTKEHYSFNGWVTNSTMTTAQYQNGASYTITGDATLYAIWEINSYTISFNANGGSGTQSAITKKFGESATLPSTSTFTKVGYTFTGWAESTTATTSQYQGGESLTVSGNKTFYAVWEVNSYTISFYESATSATPLFSVQKEYGDVLTEDDLKTIIPQQSSPASPTPTNEYRFFGWSESQTSDGSDIISKALGNQLTITNTISLYAHWLHIECYDAYVHISSGGNNDKYLGKYFQDNPYTTVVIPSNITSIGINNDGSKDYLYPFKNCTTVKNIVIPDGVQGIAKQAFYQCTSLESVHIANSVTGMGDYVFGGCSSLKNIKLSNSITLIPDGTFSGCTSLTNITIPSGVTKIGRSAFDSCSFTNITIPDSVTSIEDWAFAGCSSLTSINIPNNITELKTAIFYNCTSLTSITIPSSVTKIQPGVFDGCASLTSVEIPSGVTSLPGALFCRCTSLTSVTIPPTVTSLGQSNWSGPFEGCTSLTSITIPNSVTTIEFRTFRGCTALTSITIPNNVTAIGKEAFGDCTALTSLTIPNNVTSIGEYAFRGCLNIKNITIPSNVTTMGEKCLYGWGKGYADTGWVNGEWKMIENENTQTINVWWQEGQKPDGWADNWDETGSFPQNIIINYGAEQGGSF